MNKYFSIIAIAACAVAVASAAPTSTDPVDCSKVEEVIDELGGAQGITLLNDNFKPARNAEELAKRCAEQTDAIKTMRKYNKECFSALTQQVLSALLKTRSQYNDEYCSDKSSAKFNAGVAASKCIVENLESPKQAELKTIASFQTLVDSNIPDNKELKNRACCSVNESKKLFMNAANEKCSAHEKVLSDYIDSYTSEAMSLICPEKLECDKLTALKMSDTPSKNKFFLSPMIKVVKKLDL